MMSKTATPGPIRKIYANAKQLKFLRSRAKRKTFQGGRGSGKTTTLGNVVGMMFEAMPRAKVVLAGLTYVQLDLIVLPEVKNALSRMGYVEYSKVTPHGVYVIGQMPPDHWYKPYSSPGKRGWQYCICFINGFTLQLVSQDRPDSQRGINSDGLLVDESATMKHEFIKTVLLPAKRANRYADFSKSHMHLAYYDFSSAAWDQAGMWIYETEEKWKAELEKRAEMSDDEKERIPPETLFLESTFQDNQDVLPENYLQVLTDSLDPITLDVEVWNKRLGRLPNGFYFAFFTEKHCYFESFRYEYDDRTKLHLHQSNDYREGKLLEVSLDFNAAICWLVIAQEVGAELRVINSLFRKPSLTTDKNLVVQLAEEFDRVYQKHPGKEVAVWGDPSGRSKSAASSMENKPFFDQFCDVLIKAGWKVRRDYHRFTYPSHKDKYILINHLLEEGSDRTPRLRFNQNHNKALIIGMQLAPVTGEFKKDKRSEQTAKDREYATDGTDALDYLVWGKYRKHLPNSRSGQQNQLFVYRG
ncbi:terminase large subunit domain-containing protein [Larkinella sp. VNQ87]|uniref:terminase large subunit domain-containing protein n=1 Tax=Larkinella sp. VNQ87 TaxID=3400921 RepID=UPI003C0D3EE8